MTTTDRKRIQYEYGSFAAYCEDMFVNVYANYSDADIGLDMYIRELDKRTATRDADIAALAVCPCGEPAEIEHLCAAHYAEHAPQLQVDAIDTVLLSNGNLHVRVNGLTLYCGSLATARALYAALGAIFLTVEEQRDVDQLAAHVREQLTPIVMERAA